MAGRLSGIREQRIEKIKQLKELGVDPYIGKTERTDVIAEAREKEGEKVKVVGRVMAIRGHGGLIFMDLRDESGQMQLVIKKDNVSEREWMIQELVDIGDFVQAGGGVFKTKAGEISVEVKVFGLLSKAVRPLPSSWHGFKDVEERYRQRYVDLILNPEVRKVFDARTRMVRFLRQFMDKKGFMEVETPVLQPIYGGATARPFKTFHNALKSEFYLRIADELYLKRLIVGGYEKVYEIAKDFRNEGIDRQHNPEFTMMEFYWAYANYEDLMKLSEEMLGGAVKEVTGKYKIEYQGKKIDFSPGWERITFRDLVFRDTKIDIDEVKDEKGLREMIKSRGLKVELEEVEGYANVLDELYKEYCRPKMTGPVFLIDHPYEMKPLAKRKSGDPSKVASVALVVAGFEIFNAYNELNDPQDQRERWEEEKKLLEAGFKEAQMLDEDYIRALEYGMPPTAGWGMGIDRFTAIVTNQPNLKDTIIFPTLRPER
ncbi:lysine--tRNA ligase [Candidatus Chazhemtobacterium aquaticus]|uniref:Lysine--tRNA ligase n=1 Tax=Candidatus Chazhemtobacterium aquaticus TaxID=2715735 RepID=A0A857N6P6_9BACT|nr:lysine--tRNA ligase [Candidatus Chazhemtobacterium aquaticus]QHO63023.1 Lysyl-tRNA synthetase (class II) [Candidatus Chazhemtobacterium aquaticus]